LNSLKSFCEKRSVIRKTLHIGTKEDESADKRQRKSSSQ